MITDEIVEKAYRAWITAVLADKTNKPAIRAALEAVADDMTKAERAACIAEAEKIAERKRKARRNASLAADDYAMSTFAAQVRAIEIVSCAIRARSKQEATP